MEQLVKDAVERLLITDLFTRYFAAIDDKALDESIVKATFTKEAHLMRPNGSATVGQDNILNGHKKSFARFKATHHVITDYLIDINDTVATVRANLTAMHLWADNEANPALSDKHFLAGAVLTAKAIKVANSWRISELTNRNVWRTGEGMAEMANYERPTSQ